MYPLRSRVYLMKIISEKPLSDFNFWAGARVNADKLSPKQFADLESILEESYPNGIDETELNDLFWFDFDSVCVILGIDDEL